VSDFFTRFWQNTSRCLRYIDIIAISGALIILHINTYKVLIHQTNKKFYFLNNKLCTLRSSLELWKNSRQVLGITTLNRTELLGWFCRRGCLLDDERNILSLLALLTFISRLSSFPSQNPSLSFYRMFNWRSIIIITTNEDGISNRNN